MGNGATDQVGERLGPVHRVAGERVDEDHGHSARATVIDVNDAGRPVDGAGRFLDAGLFFFGGRLRRAARTGEENANEGGCQRRSASMSPPGMPRPAS